MSSDPICSILFSSVVTLLVTFLTAIPVIRYLRWKKLGQQIRDDGPQRHLTKAGTPTMGGVVILLGVMIGTLLTGLLMPTQDRTLALLLGVTIAFAAVGSIDDWGKIKRGRSLGLRAREKLVLQLIISTLFVCGLLFWLHQDTSIGIPGLGLVNIGWLYWPLAILFITAISNAVNLTDGLDGLATGTTAASSVALALVAYTMQTPTGIASSAFLACLTTACLAFLWYNRHPARVFMGDTGSLSLGAVLAGSALLLHQEVLFLLIGFIFLIEMGSVIIQVISFKTTGKRVFRMSPFHHHLELGGWSETKIVTRAWVLAVLLAIAAFFLHLLTQK